MLPNGARARFDPSAALDPRAPCIEKTIAATSGNHNGVEIDVSGLSLLVISYGFGYSSQRSILSVRCSYCCWPVTTA